MWKSDKNKEGKGSASGVALAANASLLKNAVSEVCSLARASEIDERHRRHRIPDSILRRTLLNSGGDEMAVSSPIETAMIPLAAMDGCVFVWDRFISVAPGGHQAVLLCYAH